MTTNITLKAKLQQKQNITGNMIQRGEQGIPGEAATIEIGTVTTGAPGSDASVTNSGTENAAIFDFVIPSGIQGIQGEQGIQGIQGEQGIQGNDGASAEITGATASVTNTVGTPSVTVTSGGTSLARSFDFAFTNLKGEKGDTGDTGATGFSPIANVTKSGSTSTITITDVNGTTTSTVYDGTLPSEAIKAYLDTDGLLTDSKGLADVQYYAHSTYDGTKFTKVGSPTITDDGVITYFPAQSGLYTESFTPFSASSNWVVEGSIKGSDGTKSYPIFTIRNNSVNAEVINITMMGSTNASHPSALLIYYPTDASTRPFVYTSNNMWQANTQYYYKVLYDGKLKVYFGTDRNNLTLVQTISTIFTNYNFNRIMFNGLDINSWQPERVGISLDLKNFSVSIDGATVFNGNQTGIDTYTIGGTTVTIPYTLSKTGSKIVDSVYRTQVTSLYNQQGYAPYYTLSDTDFTLPMGELYGFISNACDGDWIYSGTNLATSTASGEYTIDLTDILPKDDYDYMCVFSNDSLCNSTDTTPSRIYAQVFNPTAQTIWEMNEIPKAQFSGSQAGNNLTFLGKINYLRQMKIKIENLHGGLMYQNTKLVYYRRIGKK